MFPFLNTTDRRRRGAPDGTAASLPRPPPAPPVILQPANDWRRSPVTRRQILPRQPSSVPRPGEEALPRQAHPAPEGSPTSSSVPLNHWHSLANFWGQAKWSPYPLTTLPIPLISETVKRLIPEVPIIFFILFYFVYNKVICCKFNHCCGLPDFSCSGGITVKVLKLLDPPTIFTIVKIRLVGIRTTSLWLGQQWLCWVHDCAPVRDPSHTNPLDTWSRSWRKRSYPSLNGSCWISPGSNHIPLIHTTYLLGCHSARDGMPQRTRYINGMLVLGFLN